MDVGRALRCSMLRPVWLSDDVIWENKVYCDGDWHRAQLTRLQFLLLSDPKRSFDLAKDEFEWEPFKVKHGATRFAENTYNVSWERLGLNIGFERVEDRTDFLRRYTAREYAFPVTSDRIGTTLSGTIRRAMLQATELAKTSFFSDHDSRIKVAQLYTDGLSEIAGIVEGVLTVNYAATVSRGLKVVSLILDGVRAALQCDKLIENVKEAIGFWEVQFQKNSLDHYHSFKFVLRCLVDLIDIVEFSSSKTSKLEMVAAGSVVAQTIRDALDTLELHQNRLLLEVSLEAKAKDEQPFPDPSIDVPPGPVFGDSFVEYSVEPEAESRAREIQEIDQAFGLKKIVILHGLPGMGKSTLAKFYSKGLAPDFRTVLVSLARVDLSPQSVLTEVCELLKIGNGKIGDELKDAFRRHSAETSLLLVIDDILNLHVLDHLKCIDGKSRILCTALQCQERDDIAHVEVRSLQREDARRALLRNARLTKVAPPDVAQVDHLLNMLDGCAFRLVMAGKMYSQTQSWQIVIDNVMQTRPSSFQGEYRPTNSQMVGSVYDFLRSRSEVDGYADAVRIIPALSVFATRRVNDWGHVEFENGSCAVDEEYFRFVSSFIGLPEFRFHSALNVMRNFGFYSSLVKSVPWTPTFSEASIHSEILMFAVAVAERTKFNIDEFAEDVAFRPASSELLERVASQGTDVSAIILEKLLQQNPDVRLRLGTGEKELMSGYYSHVFSCSTQCVLLCYGVERVQNSAHKRFNLDLLELMKSEGNRNETAFMSYKDEFLCIYGEKSWRSVKQMRLLEKMEAVDALLGDLTEENRYVLKIGLVELYYGEWEPNMSENEVKECLSSQYDGIFCEMGALYSLPFGLLPSVLPHIALYFNALVTTSWCDYLFSKGVYFFQEDHFETARALLTAHDRSSGRTLMFYTEQVHAWFSFVSVDELDFQGYSPLAVNHSGSRREILCRMGALLQTPSGKILYHPRLAEYGYVDPIEDYDRVTRPKIEVPIVRNRGTHQPEVSDFLP